MKRSMLCGASFLIGIWLIIFQVASVSYGAPEPYVSTGFPKAVVVSESTLRWVCNMENKPQQQSVTTLQS